MPEDVPTDEALRKAGRQALWLAFGLTVFWLVLAYPVVITVGWGQWVFFVLLGWAAAGWTYSLQRKRIRAAGARTASDPGAG